MAWPGGDGLYTDTTIDLILKHTDIRFARGTTPTHTFDLPDRFMKWLPTCFIIDSTVLQKADQFLAAEPKEDMLFYVWGHGYELDVYDLWDTFEALIAKMTEADDVCLITTTEFYRLYQERIPS